MKEDKKEVFVIFNNDKTSKTYNKRVKGLLKKKRVESIDDKYVKLIDYSHDYTIEAKNKITSGNLDPKGLIYPAIISYLTVFMGKEFDYRYYLRDDGKKYRNDNTYTRQIGLSLEGFTLRYGMSNLINNNDLGINPLINSFDYEDFDYELINSQDNLKNTVVSSIAKDFPIIAFYKNQEPILYIGYKNHGEVLIKLREPRVLSNAKDVKDTFNWEKDLSSLVIIKGFKEKGTDKKHIIIKTLKYAIEMIRSNKDFINEYGYGNHSYTLWINRLNEDQTYSFLSNNQKFITPEKFDLAERRFYLWNFFDQISHFFKPNVFTNAQDIVIKIHKLMREIYNLVCIENKGMLLGKPIRDKCINIIKEARTLDLKLAEELEYITNN